MAAVRELAGAELDGLRVRFSSIRQARLFGELHRVNAVTIVGRSPVPVER